MKHECETCKFSKRNKEHEPCFSCYGIWGHTDFKDYWQPRKPRRKDLQAQLSDLQQRYDALMDCYLTHEEPDGHGGMVVDFGKVLVEHEQEVTRLKAEREVAIENMAAKQGEIDDVWKQLHARDEDIADFQEQLAAKQAIIDQQERELAEVKAERDMLREWKKLYWWAGLP